MAQFKDKINGQFISAAMVNRIAAGDSEYIVGSIVDTGQIMRDLSKSVNQELAKILKKYSKTFSKQINNSSFAEMHHNIAEGSRKAVIQAYAASGIGSSPSYRWNDTGKLKRYSNGAMEKAFNDPKFITSDGKSIFFADRFILDSHAPQWYRLNFGAAPSSSKNPNTPKMKFPPALGGGVQFPGAELVGFKPSKPFSVPARGLGMWSSTAAGSTPGKTLLAGANRSGSNFGYLYVGTSMIIRNRKGDTGKKSPFFRSRPSAFGIQGKRYLDAGSAYINRHYPKELSKLITSMERNARKNI